MYTDSIYWILRSQNLKAFYLTFELSSNVISIEIKYGNNAILFFNIKTTIVKVKGPQFNIWNHSLIIVMTPKYDYKMGKPFYN